MYRVAFKYLVVGSTTFAAGFFLSWVLLNHNTSTSDLQWKFGKSEFAINVKQDLTTPDALLRKIFSDSSAKEGTISWLKTNQKIFPAADPDLAYQIELLKPDSNLAKLLRDISEHKKGPWEQLAQTVSVGVPAKANQPRRTFASVCESGAYRGRKILLEDITGTRRITVQATSLYPCPKGLKNPDIQLNAVDAKSLFGDASFQKHGAARAAIVQ
ncbi:MAG TPA: hypothetical protein VIU46_05260 [Gallionellaceae bacterium]